MSDPALDDQYNLPVGRVDKPFHRPECRCEDCERWVRTHPIRGTDAMSDAKKLQQERQELNAKLTRLIREVEDAHAREAAAKAAYAKLRKDVEKELHEGVKCSAPYAVIAVQSRILRDNPPLETKIKCVFCGTEPDRFFAISYREVFDGYGPPERFKRYGIRLDWPAGQDMPLWWNYCCECGTYTGHHELPAMADNPPLETNERLLTDEDRARLEKGSKLFDPKNLKAIYPLDPPLET